MSNKHTAVLPNGTVIKRTSANRLYTHVVAIGPTPKIDRIAQAEHTITTNTRYIAELNAALAYLVNGGALAFNPENGSFATAWRMTGYKKGGSYNEGIYGHSLLIAVAEDVTDEAEARTQAIAHFEGRIEVAEAVAIKDIAALAEIQQGPEFVDNKWGYAGWCGRLDLAQKLAGQSWGNREVRILEAEVAA